ncbi:hypothetical protein QJS10_CPB21g00286 [Acorus calamus]|uniref:Late embryogenesis abundant protein LEA-2 subgroup domain-containing protein n=1 Tax=Acorus calamus TaxID=4465 RepID=A0AAV9C4F3_ACOCL|nr:hypothetical protein QJS10_CPB21g00286 [Acorus calamus]
MPRQYRPSSNTRPQHSPSFICCIVCTSLFLLFMFGLAVLLTWLIVRPGPVEYSIEDASVTHYNLTSDNTLNATFDVTLLSHNRNRRVSIYYDSVDLSVWYADQMVAFGEAAPFHQPRRNQTRLELEAVAKGMPLPKGVAGKLKKELAGGGGDEVAEIDVKLKARVRFKVGVWKSRHYTLDVDCDQVKVRFGEAKGGTGKGFQRKDCAVHT